MNLPPAEIHPNAQTVGRLLEAECPELAGHTIRMVDEGWDNFTFLIGKQLAARLPRREVAAPLLVNEQRWLPVLAPRLSLETPAPVYVGQPHELFPWPWSVVKWIPGAVADTHVFHSADTGLLAENLLKLHQPAPGDAPMNPFRGVPLSTKNEIVEERLIDFGQRPGADASRLAAVWREACSVNSAGQRVWVHGDLHPRNVVVRDGSLVGLIDWGDVHGGDAATDVACAWLLIANAPRRLEFLNTYGASEALVCRAKGWAVHLGLVLVRSGEPRHTQLGLAALERVVADS